VLILSTCVDYISLDAFRFSLFILNSESAFDLYEDTLHSWKNFF
jgi:hypothetical protein